MLNRATGVSAQPAISAILVDDETARVAKNSPISSRNFPISRSSPRPPTASKRVKLIEDLEPDLVFLDVQMPGLDGMGVIRKLREKNIPLPYFVMATAYDQYAVEAFRWEALDYLLKPVDKERLALAVERARKSIAEKAKAAATGLAPRSNRRCNAPSC